MDIAQQLTKYKIHMTLIQETHIPRDAEYTKNEYGIITSAALTKKHPNLRLNAPGIYAAVAAIAIHQELAQHISQIERISARILKITLDHAATHTPRSIIVTYAPHQGYTTKETQDHLNKAQQTLEQITNTTWQYGDPTRMGHFASMKHTQKYTTRSSGQNAVRKPDEGNAVRLANVCKKTHAIPLNTWERDR